MSEDPTAVTVVHSPACHFCDDAEAALADLTRTFPLTVRRVALDSAEGMALVVAHRPAMSPLVLVDGQFFSSGRLPRRKLAALLGARGETAALPVGGGDRGL